MRIDDPDGPNVGERRRAIRKAATRKLAKQYAPANRRAKYGPTGKPAPVRVVRLGDGNGGSR
jgi:hypothetical protein